MKHNLLRIALLFSFSILVNALALANCRIVENVEVWEAKVASCEKLTLSHILSSPHFEVSHNQNRKDIARLILKHDSGVLVSFRPLKKRFYDLWRTTSTKENTIFWLGEWQDATKEKTQRFLDNTHNNCEEFEKEKVYRIAIFMPCCDVLPYSDAACILGTSFIRTLKDD